MTKPLGLVFCLLLFLTRLSHGFEVCHSQGTLDGALRVLFTKIQKDEIESLSWPLFVVTREYERSYFTVTGDLFRLVCSQTSWVHTKTPDLRLRPSIFTNVG